MATELYRVHLNIVLMHIECLKVNSIITHKLAVRADNLPDLLPNGKPNPRVHTPPRLPNGTVAKMTKEEYLAHRADCVERSRARNPDTYKKWYQANRERLNAKNAARRRAKRAAAKLAKLEKLNGNR